MNATIKSDLLIDLNRAGRNVLAYIIDHQLSNRPTITLSKYAVVTYFEKRISPKYASTVNAQRGINELLLKKVISPATNDSSGEVFTIDHDKLRLNGHN